MYTPKMSQLLIQVGWYSDICDKARKRQGNTDLMAIKWIYRFVTQRNTFTQMSEDNVQHKVTLERQNS